MNHRIALGLLLFALLTQPDGYVVRIAKAQIVAILTPRWGDCPLPESHAIVQMANGSHFCVAEHPDTAAAEVEKP